MTDLCDDKISRLPRWIYCFKQFEKYFLSRFVKEKKKKKKNWHEFRGLLASLEKKCDILRFVTSPFFELALNHTL